jgi:hypothetical protein
VKREKTRRVPTPGRPSASATAKRPNAAPTVAAAGEAAAVVKPAAWRCWTWRARHGCGCWRAADCLLSQPLPVHPDQPCRGMYDGGGQWRSCCEGAA